MLVQCLPQALAEFATDFPLLLRHGLEADPELHRRFLERIPVVELGTQRVELVVTVGKMRHLLGETLDAAPGIDAEAARG